MSEQIRMTQNQKFGNEILNAGQVTALRQRHKEYGKLTNLELEKLLWTAEFCLGEIEHVLQGRVLGN